MLFLKIPNFWFSNPNTSLKISDKLLHTIYNYHNKKKYKYKSNIPVIAIGGVSVGGAGKTPTTIKIAQILKKLGYNPLVGLRGYGRLQNNPIIVNPNNSFKEVGDEAIIISKHTTTAVTKDRSQLEEIAHKQKCNIIILDDGWSQRDLFVDKKILVIDGHQNLGNQLLFPIGPLRIKLNEAVNQADIVIFLNNDKFDILNNITNLNKIIYMKTISDFSNISNNIVAFSGLGCNQKFFDSLKNFNIIKKFSFPDHYPYSDNDINNIVNFSQSESIKLNTNIDIITTEKDYQRITAYQKKIKYIKINLEFNSENDYNQMVELLQNV